MKLNFWKSLFLLVTLGTAPFLVGQTPDLTTLTLGEAVKEARAANLGLQAEGLKVDIKKRDHDLSFDKLYPSVSVGGGLVRLNDTRTIDLMEAYSPQKAAATGNGNIYADFDNMNLGLQFKAQFVFSLAILKAIEQTSIDYANSRISYDLAAERLDRDVKKEFFQLLVLQESIKVTENQLTNAQQRYQEAQTNFKAGQASELAVLQAKVAWENRKPGVDDLKVNYSQLLFLFENLLGRAPDPSVSLSGSLDIPVPGSDPDPAVVTEKYFERRLDVQTAEGQVRAVGGYLQIQDAQLYPNLIVQLNADPTLNAPFSGSTNWGTSSWYQQTGNLAVLLDWKLDSFIPGSSYNNQRADLVSQQHLAELNLNQTRLAAKTEVMTLFNKIRKSTSALRSLTENVDSAQQAYHLTETAYKSGARSFLEVQDAELQYQVAQLNLLNEKQLLNSSLLDLETALNTPREEIYGN